VELLAEATGAAASCLVEVESPQGAKLRLELKAIQTSALAELIRAFAASWVMLQITPQMRILVAVEAVDFRKGHWLARWVMPGEAERRSIFGVPVCFSQ
jgi:hypothetical protein